MLHLFDANVLITASNTYYPLEQVPEFWSWIVHQGTIGNIKLPQEILEEVLDGRKKDDPLLDWVKSNRSILEFPERVDPALVRKVLDIGYATELTDDELEVIGRDPFLIAYAMAGTDRCVVTTEISKPGKKRQNRRIPDVCKDLDVTCHNPFTINRTLGFHTKWQS